MTFSVESVMINGNLSKFKREYMFLQYTFAVMVKSLSM